MRAPESGFCTASLSALQLLDAAIGQLVAYAKKYPRILLIAEGLLLCLKVDDFDSCSLKWVKKARARPSVQHSLAGYRPERTAEPTSPIARRIGGASSPHSSHQISASFLPTAHHDPPSGAHSEAGPDARLQHDHPVQRHRPRYGRALPGSRWVPAGALMNLPVAVRQPSFLQRMRR